MADPFSIATGVVALVAFAGKILTKGYGTLRSLRGSSDEVKRLLIELSQLTGILVAVEAQYKEAGEAVDPGQTQSNSIPQVLESSISDCRKILQEVSEVLEKLEKSRRVVLPAKWQFLEPDVKRLIDEVERFKTIFTLCLSVDLK